MRWLGSGMNDEIGPLLFEKVTHALPVADIDGQVTVNRGIAPKKVFDYGVGRSRGTKKFFTQIIVDAYNIPTVKD